MSKDAFPYRHLSPNVKRLAGSFAPNGTGAIDQGSIKGAGIASIARSSAGVFLVTLQDKWKAVYFAGGSPQLHTAADIKVQAGDIDPSPSGSGGATVILRTVAVATPTDVAANANNRINFELDLYDGA